MIELGQMCFGNKWEGCDAPDHVSEDLYRLSELLATRRPEQQAHGLLGGEFGYGQHFENSVFEMHPYFWGECECGFEAREATWSESHPHAPHCYQTAIGALRAEKNRACGYDRPVLIAAPASVEIQQGIVVVELSFARPIPSEEIDKAMAVYDAAVKALCEARGLTYPDGSEVHCTCSHDADFAAWVAQNDHDPKCGKVLPNFRHKRTDLAVHWYKYIGRGSTMSATLDRAAWRTIFGECLASIGVGVS